MAIISGRNFSGYAPFRYDVTDFVNYGDKNVLVVRVDATMNEGWFYEGAGIYRHVWLTKTNPCARGRTGAPSCGGASTAGAAEVRITTEIENDSDGEQTCRVLSAIVDGEGKTVGTVRSAPAPVTPWGRLEFEQQIEVRNPALWSPDTPNLYRLLTTVESGGARGGPL